MVPEDELHLLNADARRSGLPVVPREVIWDEPDACYHYYPTMAQVRAWVAAAGFTIDDDVEGPWRKDEDADGEYAYHHLLATATGSGHASPRLGA